MSFNRIKNVAVKILAGGALALIGGLPICRADDKPTVTSSCSWKFGGETDPLPFILKGYYGSAFVGRNGWRWRGVVARSTAPSFLVTNGFKEKRTDGYAFLTDRFFGSKRKELSGFWIGAGGEYWRNRIRTEESPTFAHYNNFLLTTGGGYVWKISSHFYINPWAAGNFVVAGKRKIPVSGKTYQQSVFTPEVSVKLGFTF